MMMSSASSIGASTRAIRFEIFPNSQNEQIAIFGIGRVIVREDIGKLFLRAAPFARNHKYNQDWSYIPDSPMEMKNREYKLIDITDTDITFLFLATHKQTEIRLPINWNDGNWITVDDYDQFVKTHLSKPQTASPPSKEGYSSENDEWSF